MFGVSDCFGDSFIVGVGSLLLCRVWKVYLV